MTVSESALIVPVLEAEPVVRDHRDRFDPAAPAGIPAHITVLYPFLPPETITQSEVDELGEIFAGVTPFSFRLTGTAQFPGVVYLIPEPAEPFIRLTAAIATRWPEAPPYQGTYDQVIPHLTLAHTDSPSTATRLREEVEPVLPIQCRGHEAWLLTSNDGRWSLGRAFPFASPAI